MVDWNKLMTGKDQPPSHPGGPANPSSSSHTVGIAAFAPAALLALAASTMILLGQFTPMYESVEFLRITKNTFLQQDIGWAFVAGAGAIALAGLFGARNAQLSGWTALGVGVLTVGLAAFFGLSEDARTLTSLFTEAGDRLGRGREEVAIADTGIYLTAIGGLAAIAAGVAMLWSDAGTKT